MLDEFNNSSSYICPRCGPLNDGENPSMRFIVFLFSIIYCKRYIVSLLISDESGSLVANVFSKQAEELFGCSAEEMNSIRENNIGFFLGFSLLYIFS
jgi:preprotein translocase subunit SecG